MSKSPRCDICMFKDGHNGLKLVTCPTCKVSVHRECYGLTELGAKKSWCRACKTVGLLVEGRSQRGEKKVFTVKQKSRPTECVLCSHTDGVHAMHPLFDTHGSKGKHIVLHNGELAWVHTLCALTVGQHHRTSGCVYGCDIQGAYVGDGEDDEDSDDGHDMDSDISVTLHHFVIADKQFPDWWKVIQEHRQHLKCSACSKKSDAKSMRIAVQCAAGDPEEYEKFQHTHRGDQPCFEAMHIGCAMWSRDRGPNRRIYFFPGTNDDEKAEPVVAVYCRRHAEDIERSKKNGPSSRLGRNPAHTMIGYAKPQDSGVLESSERRRSTSTAKQRTSAESSHQPQLERRVSTKKSTIDGTKRASISSPPTSHRQTMRVASQSELARIVLQGKQSINAAKPTSISISPASHRQTVRVPNNEPPPQKQSAARENLKIRRQSSKDASLAPKRRDSSMVALPTIPKKTPSPAPRKIVMQNVGLDINNLIAPELSNVVAKKRPRVRSLGSYNKAVADTAKFARSPASVRRTSKMSAIPKDLPAPPPYQRVSSIARKSSSQVETKKRRLSDPSMLQDDDPVDFEQETSTAQQQPKPAKPARRLRRRYISESKTNDEEDAYYDDYDWLPGMVADVEEAISMANREGIDRKEALDARKYYWKRTSGIYGSDFRELWDAVRKKIGVDSSTPIDLSGDPPEPESRFNGESDTVEIEWHVEHDSDTEVSGKNKWVNLWTKDAELFQFDDWDEKKGLLRKTAAP